MKRLLLFLFLVVCTFVVSQAAVPTPDRDIGGVAYAMPSQQIDNNLVSAVVQLPVKPVMLCEYTVDRITPKQEDAKQMEQCTMEVISPPPYRALDQMDKVDNQTGNTGANFT